MKVVAVHDRRFHPDDVFAVAILRLLYPKLRFVRTRDPKIYNKADLRIDVGHRYDPKTGDYDHHQLGGAGKRPGGIPYASVGLIWKHFGRRLTSSAKVWQFIDKKMIQEIDAMDNGVKPYKAHLLEPYDLGEIIDAFNPNWQEKKKDYDRQFGRAVAFATELMRKEIFAAEGVFKAGKIIRRLIAKSKREGLGYLVLDDYMPWEEAVVGHPNILYVVFRNENGWFAKAAPKKLGSFERIKRFPKRWAALTFEDLAKITGVKDAVFCHKDCFILSAKSREGAIKLVELAIAD